MKKTTAVMMMLAALAGSAALIADGGGTPVADVTPAEPAQTLVVTQHQPAAPPVVTQDKAIVYCCGGGPADTSVVATAEPPQTLVSAQDKKPVIGVKPKDIKPKTVPCPDTHEFNHTDNKKANPYAADFNPGFILEPNFGGTTVNKHFHHTFYWKDLPRECCQCVSGTLTLHLKATKDIPINDSWSIQIDKKNLQSGKVKDLPKSGIIQLNAASLEAFCCKHRLSFAVQDDTTVLSATLHVYACCVKPCKQPAPK